jgi:hypothetical protein
MPRRFRWRRSRKQCIAASLHVGHGRAGLLGVNKPVMADEPAAIACIHLLRVTPIIEPRFERSRALNLNLPRLERHSWRYRRQLTKRFASEVSG